MLKPLSEFPISSLGEFFVVKVANWANHFWTCSTMRMNGKPVRPDCKDLWILTSDIHDAHELAMFAQRHFLPKDPASPSNRVVTTKRTPTFASIIDQIPKDVAYYFSASPEVNDQALLQRLYPPPKGVHERLKWTGSDYEITSGYGRFQAQISSAPTRFAHNLNKARVELLEAVGPGFDATLDYLNASPILAAILPCLTRPAAEAVAHWMKDLGHTEKDTLVIPPLGLKIDFPFKSLLLESVGINLHASFMLNLGEVRITDYEVSGLQFSDTVATALDVKAREESLMLSHVLDLPGSEKIRVLSVQRANQRWNLRLDPVSVPISSPYSEIPFHDDGNIDRIIEEGNSIGSDAALLLRSLGKERSDFILYCVADGNSGMHFDVSAWTHEDLPMEVRLRNRTFNLQSKRSLPINHIHGPML